MSGPDHFDRIADLYARARPPYPEALWRRLENRGVLGPGVRVLELGAGTGQATDRMLAVGVSVVAVEPGPDLARVLVSRHPGLDVRVATAETVDLSDDDAFDLVAIATAVHWLDLDVVLPRLHRALVEGGHLAVWRTAYGDPEAEVTLFRRRVGEIVARRDAPPRSGPDESDTAGWTRRLEREGLFHAVHAEELRWSIDLGADAIRDLFTTFSDWTPAEADAAARAADDLGGTVTEHYVTPLIVLRRCSFRPTTG